MRGLGMPTWLSQSHTTGVPSVAERKSGREEFPFCASRPRDVPLPTDRARLPSTNFLSFVRLRTAVERNDLLKHPPNGRAPALPKLPSDKTSLAFPFQVVAFVSRFANDLHFCEKHFCGVTLSCSCDRCSDTRSSLAGARVVPARPYRRQSAFVGFPYKLASFPAFPSAPTPVHNNATPESQERRDARSGWREGRPWGELGRGTHASSADAFGCGEPGRNPRRGGVWDGVKGVRRVVGRTRGA
jgi:hypothetical protein